MCINEPKQNNHHPSPRGPAVSIKYAGKSQQTPAVFHRSTEAHLK